MRQKITKQQARQMRQIIVQESVNLEDETAMNVPYFSLLGKKTSLMKLATADAIKLSYINAYNHIPANPTGRLTWP